ncbi:hypothetical protein OQA88_4870 [Cercophora sp. LCS_1]
MSTPYQMHIVPENTGLCKKIKQTDEAAQTASKLLQQDLQNHHVFFNTSGFHNHIPHHLLALYGTGASSSSLSNAYGTNTTYQRPVLSLHESVVKDLVTSFSRAGPYLGKEKHYPDFLSFFQREMQRLGGWKPVVAEYLFKEGDEMADDMLVRLFSGFLHPLIQLMYGMEWEQEAIVAEALAQAAVHGNEIGGYLLGTEKLARESGGGGGGGEGWGVVELLDMIGADEKIKVAVRNEDGNKIRDGVLVRARDEMLRVAARVRMREDDVEERTVEMFDACVYMASAAAVHPVKVPKFDFFLMHHVNASPIFVTINAQDWIPLKTKARLLEWKIRMDLIEYAARGVPPLSVEKIAGYKPGREKGTSPVEIVSQLHDFPDDGHAIKLARAALICRDISRLYEDRDWVKIKGDELWLRIFNLIVDSVEAPGEHWVRTCGLEEAWKDIPDSQDAKL